MTMNEIKVQFLTSIISHAERLMKMLEKDQKAETPDCTDELVVLEAAGLLLQSAQITYQLAEQDYLNCLQGGA